VPAQVALAAAVDVVAMGEDSITAAGQAQADRVAQVDWVARADSAAVVAVRVAHVVNYHPVSYHPNPANTASCNAGRIS
jgi:hypothetical protein